MTLLWKSRGNLSADWKPPRPEACPFPHENVRSYSGQSYTARRFVFCLSVSTAGQLHPLLPGPVERGLFLKVMEERNQVGKICILSFLL